MSKIHRLLKRQLDKSGFDKAQLDAMTGFLQQVNEAYHSFEQDFSHLEHILEQSSQELYSANQQLKTEVKNIEGKLSKVATNIKDVIFEMDTNGRWTYLNPAWEKMSGFPIDKSLGKKYHHFLPKELTEPFKKKVTTKDGDFKVHRTEFLYTKPDGKKIWLNFSIKPINNKNNVIEGFIGTISDISEIKKTERKLIDAKEKEEKANKAKDQFLSIMSHEIRTPLNAVIGVSNLLLMENPKASQLDNLKVLRYSSKHLLALVNDILDYNKIVSGSLLLEQDDFSLEDVLNSQHQMFQHKAFINGLSLEVKRNPGVPKMVMGDTLRLGQILTNLIGNAIKFTKKGKVTLEVSLVDKNDELSFVEFRVEDTGIGIPKNKLKNIFLPFVQANSNTTRLYGGTGLGLAICKRLVDIMGGQLHCQSKFGEGSTFSFTLPFRISANKLISDDFMVATTPNNPEMSSLSGAEVLVVEDNKVNIIIIKKFLKKWGVKPDIAENGLIGFEMSAKKRYDIIFMDIEMPVMNGFQAASGIRESSVNLNRETPIIALTASTGDGTQKELQENGINGLILKPFDPKELYATIEECLNVPSSIRL